LGVKLHSDPNYSLATQWMWVYNNERPHSSIGGIPPRKLLEAI